MNTVGNLYKTKKINNVHLIFIAVFFALFFILADFCISVTGAIIVLSCILLFIFFANYKTFFDCKIDKLIAVLLLVVFTILINIRSSDYLKSNPMYIYSMLLAVISIMFLQVDIYSRNVALNILLVIAIIPAVVALFSRLFCDVYLQLAEKILSNDSYDYMIYLMNEGYSGVVGGYISLSTNYIVCGIAISLSRYYEKHKVRYLFLSLFFIVALISVNRRSELIASFIAFLILLYLILKRKKRLVFLTICAITAVIILILVVCIKAQIITYQGDSRLILSIFELINGEDISNGRSALYAVAWELFLENPLFGIGFGNFRIYGSQIIGSVTNVHNIYLQLLCELGIFGAIIIFIAMALLLRCLYINFKKSKKRKNYSHSYFSLFMFVYILIVGLFDNPIFQDTFWLLLFLIIACSFKTKKIKHKKAVN